MTKKTYSNKLFWFIFILFIIIFSYLRLKPIYFQTVGYTYDQGRDFLKTVEVVLYKNPTFIGPTTGITGIYHGAWWYYVLAIPFIIFGGLPIGFYYFNFIIHLVLLIIFILFLKRHFSLITAIILSLLITVSPYFIFTSLFVANNIMVLPVITGWIIINFLLLEKKVKNKNHLLTLFCGLFLGLIMEFEFAFGLFLIPAYFILILFYKPLRPIFSSLKNSLFLLIGLIVSFSLRILFELKHNFTQTRTLLGFFFKPKLYNPKSYMDVVRDRYNLFLGYYKSIFFNDNLALICGLLLLALLFIAIKNKDKIYKNSLIFFSLIMVILFAFSTLYKDNFWTNYYEGIQYIFLMLMAIILTINYKVNNLIIDRLKKTVLIVLLILSLFKVNKEFNNQLKFEGLQVQSAAVDYVVNQEPNKDKFCLKVYTPPVIPYTYDYLFLYKKLSKKIPNDPAKDWVNNQCWFIIEEDEYKFRKEKWMTDNIPVNSKIIKDIKLKDINIQLRSN